MRMTMHSTNLGTGDRVPYVHLAFPGTYCKSRTLSKSELRRPPVGGITYMLNPVKRCD